jgi:hypothetical protein
LENAINKEENLRNFDTYNPLNEFIRIESDSQEYQLDLITES